MGKIFEYVIIYFFIIVYSNIYICINGYLFIYLKVNLINDDFTQLSTQYSQNEIIIFKKLVIIIIYIYYLKLILYLIF